MIFCLHCIDLEQIDVFVENTVLGAYFLEFRPTFLSTEGKNTRVVFPESRMKKKKDISFARVTRIEIQCYFMLSEDQTYIPHTTVSSNVDLLTTFKTTILRTRIQNAEHNVESITSICILSKH